MHMDSMLLAHGSASKIGVWIPPIWGVFVASWGCLFELEIALSPSATIIFDRSLYHEFVYDCWAHGCGAGGIASPVRCDR